MTHLTITHNGISADVYSNGITTIIVGCGIPYAEARRKIKLLGIKNRITAAIATSTDANVSRFIHQYAKAGVEVFGPWLAFVLPYEKNRPVSDGITYVIGDAVYIPPRWLYLDGHDVAI